MTNRVEINGLTVTAPQGAVISDHQLVTPAQTKITRLAFRNRFTFAEKVAIETAAETDAAVRVLLKDQESATFIDLFREDTQQGIQMLVDKALLNSARASEVLSLTIQPEEAFAG